METLNTASAENERTEWPMQPATSRSVLGLEVAALERGTAATLLEGLMRERRSVKLAFVNAHLANRAWEDRALHKTLDGFLLLNDGSGLNLASWLIYGRPYPDNLNGTDFTPYFLDRCGLPLKIFLLGARPSVVERAADVFARRWPQHSLAGYRDGFFSEEERKGVLDTIQKAGPDLVFVAMGNGIQERWVARLVPDAALSAWGVGALFDFLADEVPRAPLWMRRLGIEWTYRLLLEPGRLWQRYLIGNPKFVLRVLRERIRRPQR